MDLYGQEPEVRLLAAFVSSLEHKAVVDVGAERGAFAESMLAAGSDDVHVFEPEPNNATFLRKRFRDDPRVTVHECALGDSDGVLRLHRSVTPGGEPISFGHTVLERPDTEEIAWRTPFTVPARSLASLLESGETPARVGVLKIDTEGHDLAVLTGIGALDCDVVMVEHWSDLPRGLGPCPWSTDEIVGALRDRGFDDFAFILHRGAYTILQWNDGTAPAGTMGNLIFLHERVRDLLLPNVLACASELMRRSALAGDAATDRLMAVEGVATERLAAIEELQEEAVARQAAGADLRDLHFMVRARQWVKPRIGLTHHYPPKPLLVPAKYLGTAPPQPAPRISIVTPSFEHGRFVERTLRSVLCQHYPTLEYVVQDGGSSDETVAILRRYESMLTAWRSESDRGQADAINRGFAHTTGEIMSWLNSDDLLLPGALAYVARYFRAHPSVDVVYGQRLMIDENDDQVGAWILPRHDDEALKLADYVPQETLFWRRRIWEASGGRVDPTFDYALDWDLLLRFQDAGATMVRLPRFLGAFRVHPQQKTTASADVGDVEIARLRQRVHGRTISVEEMRVRMRPYFVRHIAAHKWQRAVDRLPLRRVRVRTSVDQS